MSLRRSAVVPAVALLMLALTSAVNAQPQPATQPSKGPFRVALSDVNVCLDTLAGIEKSLGQAAPAGNIQAVRKVLEAAKATAGQPDKSAPVPWAFANNLAAGPYLQNVTATSVIIRWTAVQSDTAVRYGVDGKLTSAATAVRLPAPRRMNEAQLTGLTPGARYTYSVHMGERDVIGTFRAAPAGDEPFSFAVWGDTQMDNPDHTAQPALAAQMAKLPIDLALSIGDIVDLNVTDSDFYEEFFLPAAGFLKNVPVFAAVGNHESLGDPDLARYRRWMRRPGPDKAYYAFTYANCRFIVLDSNEPALGPPQLEWLKQELASDACRKARFRFLALHHSPYCQDWYGGEKKVQQLIVPLAEEGRVDMIFGGHFHCYNRGTRTVKDHKTHYIVTGGGGGMYTQPPRFGPGNNEYPFMAKHEWKHHFVLVKVDGAGLSVQAIDEKGEVFDEFSSPTVPAGAPVQPAKGATVNPPATPAAPPAAALALSPDDTRFCTISADDRMAALAAIAEGRKMLAGNHAESAFRLELVGAALEEARDSSREGAWTGEFGRTGHLIPLVKVSGSFHYRLKPSESADASVKAMLENRSIKGMYRIQGEDLIRGCAYGAGLSGGWRWVLVDAIAPK